QPVEPLAARDRRRLATARVERRGASVRTLFVEGERRRIALVDVLGRVHDDGESRRCGGEPLARRDAERLLVEVEHVWLVLADQTRELAVVGIRVPVN